MIQPIRLATKDEVDSIASTSDLTPGSAVYAMSQPDGGVSLAVLRPCWELDPVYYGEGTSAQRKLLFAWGLENILRANGIQQYYFNVPASEEMVAYRKIVEETGAVATSPTPEIRFKKTL